MQLKRQNLLINTHECHSHENYAIPTQLLDKKIQKGAILKIGVIITKRKMIRFQIFDRQIFDVVCSTGEEKIEKNGRPFVHRIVTGASGARLL